MPGHRRLIRHYSEATSIFLADLRGLDVVGAVDTRSADALTAVVDLRDGAIQLDIDVYERGAQRWASKLAFNETMLAPKAFDVGPDATMRMTLGLSTYARFRSARDQLLSMNADTRIAAMLANELGTPLQFTHTLGVNCTLETSDGKLLTTRRSSRNASGAGLLSVAMSEASNYDDCAGVDYDPRTTALRGLAEELGLRAEDMIDVVFHSLIADAYDGGVALLAHATTNLSAAEVTRRHATAPDRHEVGEMLFGEIDIAALTEMLTNGERWVPWGVPGMLGLVGLRHGQDAAAALETLIAEGVFV